MTGWSPSSGSASLRRQRRGAGCTGEPQAPDVGGAGGVPGAGAVAGAPALGAGAGAPGACPYVALVIALKSTFGASATTARWAASIWKNSAAWKWNMFARTFDGNAWMRVLNCWTFEL